MHRCEYADVVFDIPPSHHFARKLNFLFVLLFGIHTSVVYRTVSTYCFLISYHLECCRTKLARQTLVELAWSWLRYQPGSALSEWWRQRFANAGMRRRKVGIVALARKLAIAFWQFLENGVVPEGATVKG